MTALEWLTALPAQLNLPGRESLSTFEFGAPHCLWLLLLIALFWWRRTRKGRAPAVQYSSIKLLAQASRHTRARRNVLPLILRTLGLACLILAIAQPRVEKDTQDQKSEGIDIMLVLDASRSMDSRDFDFKGQQVSRREALQKVMEEFLKQRPRDRIGVVGFAEKPFLISPLTLDHSWMMEALSEVQTSLGTAIGSGVEASVDLLAKGEGTNKVAIVVTDGLNTSGVNPLQSARTAQRFGVRLYTVSVVSYSEMQTGGADGITLNQMARMTGGQFFQAANGASLESIYRQIDRLEKREFKQAKLKAYRELFMYFAAAAAVFLLLELLLSQGRRMRVP